MNPIDTYLREQSLPHAAVACPELEALVLLDVAKRYPGQRKGLMAASALGVFGRDLGEEHLMLTYIDSLVAIGRLFRHNFTYVLTPSGVERLEQLKSNLRGPLMRALS
jgi:hypothetical protein